MDKIKEKTGISREEAINLLNTYIKNQNLIKHCLATEAVMKKLARHFGEDEDIWGIAGLLHDLDAEITKGDLKIHTLEAEKILKDNGVKDFIIEAIKMHNEVATGKKRKEKFHIALAAGETITGLITATTLVYPDKRLKLI